MIAWRDAQAGLIYATRSRDIRQYQFRIGSVAIFTTFPALVGTFLRIYSRAINTECPQEKFASLPDHVARTIFDRKNHASLEINAK